MHENRNTFFKIQVHTLLLGIKHVLMYTRTHLARSDEVDMCVLIESKQRNACSQQPFCVT